MDVNHYSGVVVIRFLAAVSIVVCLISVGCQKTRGSKDTSGTPPGSGREVVQQNTTAVSELSTDGHAMVDRKGGVIRLGDASVLVPPNSVSEPQKISISKIGLTKMAHEVPATLKPVGYSYILSLEADKRVGGITVQIPVNSAQVEPGKEHLVNIYIWNGRDYIALPTRYNSNDSTITASLDKPLPDEELRRALLASNEEVRSSAVIGLYPFAALLELIKDGCEKSGGAFNGAYCECPWGMSWSQSEAKCIQPPKDQEPG